jgi:hypothetical protein
MSINKVFDDLEEKEKFTPRHYLGVSQIGSENDRMLWFIFRWSMPIDVEPRVSRLLDLGNLLEDHLVEKMRKIKGAKIYDKTKDGKQFGAKAFGGHVSGHIDGLAKNIPGLNPDETYLLEFKTANDRRFSELKKLGSYCDWSQEYKAQVHLYMGMFKLKRCISIVYNKNNSDLYTEIIDFDEELYDLYLEKAKRIVESQEPPENRIPETDYRIRSFMSKEQQDIYLGKKLPTNINCRNCRFAQPKTDGEDPTWFCNSHKRNLTVERQLKACPRHNFVPELISARCINKTDSSVEYKHEDITIINSSEKISGKTPNNYSSKELIHIVNNNYPRSVIDNLNEMKTGSMKNFGPITLQSISNIEEEDKYKDVPF